MRYLYIFIALAGLVLVLIPSILFFFDTISPDQMKNFMVLGTILWFAGAIPWLGRKKKEA